VAPYRIRNLHELFEQVKHLDPEVLRYFPIAVVALFESFFRSAIATLVDAGAPYVDNIAATSYARDLRFDFTVVRGIAGKSITMGDFFSHLVGIKNLGQIDSLMTAALGRPFLTQLGVVHDRWAVEVEGKPAQPIISDLNAVLAQVSRAFEDRHVYAHEYADSHPITAADVAAILAAATLFLEAGAAVMSDTLHPDAPLTQAAMNARSLEEYTAMDEALSSRLTELATSLSQGQATLLQRAATSWRDYRDALSELESLEAEGGSMQPLLYNMAAARITRDGLGWLKQYFG
jgi:uncharacterized protein YecT (DUF1311 family)